MSSTYTKRELIDELAGKFKLSKRRVDHLLVALAAIAYREAPTGFTLPGICKLDVKERKERRARNPQTGEPLLIGAHKVLRVRPLKHAKLMVAPTPPNLITVLPLEEKAPEEAPAVAPASAVTSSPVAPAAPVSLATGAAAAPAPAAAASEEDLALFSFKCPFCRADIEVSVDCVGDRINCPACNRAFAVPPVGQQAKADVKPAAKAVAAAAAEEQFVSFLCKSCGQEIEAPIDMAGSQDECPACGASILVPYVSEPGTTQALRASSASQETIEAAKSRTLRIELPDEV